MPAQTDILITGANGFIGSGLIPVPVARGKWLRGRYRRSGQAAPSGVEMVVGDLLQPDSLGPAVSTPPQNIAKRGQRSCPEVMP